MPILIDGYNLMHAAGLMKARFGPGGFEKARRSLLGFLAASLDVLATQVTVVFDARTRHATPEPQSDADPAAHGIRVEFADAAASADDRIEQLIRADSAPKQLTVVSSDQRIRTAAKRRGARPIKSDAFLDELLARRRSRPQAAAPEPPEKPTGRAVRDSEFWLREFEHRIDERDLRELAGPDWGDAAAE